MRCALFVQHSSPLRYQLWPHIGAGPWSPLLLTPGPPSMGWHLHFRRRNAPLNPISRYKAALALPAFAALGACATVSLSALDQGQIETIEMVLTPCPDCTADFSDGITISSSGAARLEHRASPGAPITQYFQVTPAQFLEFKNHLERIRPADPQPSVLITCGGSPAPAKMSRIQWYSSYVPAHIGPVETARLTVDPSCHSSAAMEAKAAIRRALGALPAAFQNALRSGPKQPTAR
jgi:hypothetical protein